MPIVSSQTQHLDVGLACQATGKCLHHWMYSNQTNLSHHREETHCSFPDITVNGNRCSLGCIWFDIGS